MRAERSAGRRLALRCEIDADPALDGLDELTSREGHDARQYELPSGAREFARGILQKFRSLEHSRRNVDRPCQPQHQASLAAVIPQVWTPVDASAVKRRPPATGVGVVTGSVIRPIPSWAELLFPQQYAT